MTVVVFDLDDTLYKELTFVESGFKAVSFDLHNRFGLKPEETFQTMWLELQRHGRGKVFNCVLARYGLETKGNILHCLNIYRKHRPDISLYDDARRCLEELKAYPMYIVTDGNKLVQQSKLQALGLYDHEFIRHCYITRRYGIKNEKPSPHCFMKICEREQVDPKDVVYIGDNPNKDFVGIKPLGFRTVRIIRGAFSELIKPNDYEAEHQIESLDELANLLGLNAYKDPFAC
ncbi:HAD family hydrolase [Paenibacillus sp. EPM92]|uniref:HAD family hydrolase n=1 Tax=Paenibacillus sp. EPM92 TaxID=1561195 RepID=UPI001915F274|nr:HAD family hydrolase [Paenibacillus sp. EPM92]